MLPCKRVWVVCVFLFMVRACGTCHCSGGWLRSRGRRLAAAWLPLLWWCLLPGRNTRWCLLPRRFPLCHRGWRSSRCTLTCRSSPAGKETEREVAASEYTNQWFLQLTAWVFPYLHFVYYLFVEGVNHMHPVVLCRVVAEYGLGETTAHIDQVVEGHCCDTTLGDGDVGP